MMDDGLKTKKKKKNHYSVFFLVVVAVGQKFFLFSFLNSLIDFKKGGNRLPSTSVRKSPGRPLVTLLAFLRALACLCLYNRL